MRDFLKRGVLSSILLMELHSSRKFLSPLIAWFVADSSAWTRWKEFNWLTTAERLTTAGIQPCSLKAASNDDTRPKRNMSMLPIQFSLANRGTVVSNRWSNLIV